MTSHLTRVELVSSPRQFNVYLRFGTPIQIVQTGEQRRYAYFEPGSVFCRVWWQGNHYGTTRWQVAVLRAKWTRSAMLKIDGVRPGAAVLLCVEGDRRAKSVLRLIGDLERRGMRPETVAPTYWGVVHNRLMGRGEVGRYASGRHAAATLAWMLQ